MGDVVVRMVYRHDENDMLREVAAAGLLADLPQRIYTGFGKRVMDLGLIAMSLPFLLPLMLIIAFAIALDGKSPFYSQDRYGKDWKRFRLFKFRTMVYDADKRLAEYLADNQAAREEWEVNQKLRNDPRITRVGRVLRRTSLDELPQLINVAFGQMSLVGPRPMMIEQREYYPGEDYAAMHPGLTGLWQVSERNSTTFAARAEYDREYRETVGLRTDVLTIARTFRVVARCTGM